MNKNGMVLDLKFNDENNAYHLKTTAMKIR